MTVCGQLKYVLTFINNLKIKVNERNKLFEVDNFADLTNKYYNVVLKGLQLHCFPNIYNYFANPMCPKKNVPQFVDQYNIVKLATDGRWAPRSSRRFQESPAYFLFRTALFSC